MAHAAAGAHALHVSRPDRGAGADGVLVRELAFEHVADDLHVAMPVGAEALARRDAIFVEHAQRPELDVVCSSKYSANEKLWYDFEPAMVGVAAILAASGDFHGTRLYRFTERHT